MSSQSLFREPRADLWYVFPDGVDDHDLLRRYRALLSDEEMARHDRFVFAKDRHLHLVAWAHVRTMLSSYADVRPEAWRFRTNRYGRPEITGPAGVPPLRFNLSHTNGLIACIVVAELDVGVDVEDRRRQTGGLDIAHRFFSPAEVEALEMRSPEEQQLVFFEYWTLKEAYIKARGIGISLGLSRFSFSLDDSGAEIGDPRRRPPTIAFAADLRDDPQAWQFVQWQPTPHHAMAAAIRRDRRKDLEIRLREVIPGVDAPG